MPLILLVYWSTVLETRHLKEARPSNDPSLVRFSCQSRAYRDGFEALHAKPRGCGRSHPGNSREGGVKGKLNTVFALVS